MGKMRFPVKESLPKLILPVQSPNPSANIWSFKSKLELKQSSMYFDDDIYSNSGLN